MFEYSDTAVPSLSKDSYTLAREFDENMNRLRSSLFNLADMLNEAYPQRSWNVLFVEDTGARLLARFVRGALRKSGVTLPTYYIGSSREQRDHTPESVYASYIHSKSELHGNDTAMILTENIGLGRGASFMQRVVSHCFKNVDIAALVSRDGHHEGIGDMTYLGGEGHNLADVVVPAFEETISDSEGKWSNAPLTGIMANTVSLSPHAIRAQTETYRKLTHYCYARMDTVAEAYRDAR